MRYFKEFYRYENWINTEQAKHLLTVNQHTIFKETYSNLKNFQNFDQQISHLILWSDEGLIRRLTHWLNDINNARKFHHPSYEILIEAVIWAFSKQKPVIRQTQYQYEISIELIKELLNYYIEIKTLRNAQLLLMNVFIYAKRPDLCKQSFNNRLTKYFPKQKEDCLINNYKHLTSYLYIDNNIPKFLLNYLTDFTQQEFDVFINILDGKSIRKILPEELKISKSENNILHLNLIELPNSKDEILARFVYASRILKEDNTNYEILNKLLKSSKIFTNQFSTFKNDVKFWSSIFRFICKNKSDIDQNYNISHLIDFFEYKRYYENEPLTYNIKGRSFENITTHLADWQFNNSYEAKYLDYKWKPLPIEHWIHSQSNIVYIIKEITDGKRLLEESKTLKHCVFSYATSCVNGHTHIFSLSILKDNVKKPHVTIEVIKNNITQIAGKQNNIPSNKIKTIIEKWGDDNNIRYKLTN